jgi:hypothetical protein
MSDIVHGDMAEMIWKRQIVEHLACGIITLLLRPAQTIECTCLEAPAWLFRPQVYVTADHGIFFLAVMA